MALGRMDSEWEEIFCKITSGNTEAECDYSTEVVDPVWQPFSGLVVAAEMTKQQQTKKDTWKEAM